MSASISISIVVTPSMFVPLTPAVVVIAPVAFSVIAVGKRQDWEHQGGCQ
jgi:hypothetical protein